MNEEGEGKRFWTRPWKGVRGLLLWFVLLTSLAFLVVVYIDAFTDASIRLDFIVIGFLVAVVFAIVAILAFLLIRWLCCWRNFRRVLIVVVSLAVLIGLFYLVEDWRGISSWTKFKREWEAKGEHFDMASLAPAAVPDEQNFAMTPIVASSYARMLTPDGHRIDPPNTNVVNRLEMPLEVQVEGLEDSLPSPGDWLNAVKIDLAAWQRYYQKAAALTNMFPIPSHPGQPAADVLLALSIYEPAIEELRQASLRPASRFPLDYDTDKPFGILLPHVAGLKGCTMILELSACAELELGQSQKALDDVRLIMRLAESIRTEPNLISQLVRIAMVNLALQPVWEGLTEHKWSDRQLITLQEEFKRPDFIADYRLGVRGEMAWELGILDCVRRHREPAYELVSRTEGQLEGRLFAWLAPSGWFYQNQIRSARPFVEFYLPLGNVENRVISPSASRRADKIVISGINHVTPYNLLDRMLLPAVSRAIQKSASAQACVDLASVACALERYRLAHGDYPEAITSLAPQLIDSLPHDVVNGQPLKYRRTADRQFVLYSVGWNETDDGGVSGLKPDGKAMDPTKGDWVWTTSSAPQTPGPPKP